MGLTRIPPVITSPADYPGIYAFDSSGALVSSMFNTSDIFSMNGVPVLTHQPYESIGPSLTGNFLDPSIYGDMAMYSQRTCMDVANMQLYNRLSNYGAFNDGISGFVV